MKIRIINKRWYTPPFGRFRGFTLYPFIFIRPPPLEWLVRHELIHCHQVRRDGWLCFYGGYLWRKITGTKYEDEPMEREAFHNQMNRNFLSDDLESLVPIRFDKSAVTVEDWNEGGRTEIK